MKKRIKNSIEALLLMAMALAVLSCSGLTGSGSSDKVTDGYAGVNLTVQGSVPAAGVSAGAKAALADSVSLAVTDTAGTQIGTLTVTEARFALNEIELEQEDSEIDTPEEEAQELEVEYEGPFIISLLEGTSTPELPYIEILPGTYDSLKLKLEKIESSEEVALLTAGDPLIGNSVYLEGTYTGTTSGGTVTNMPFILTIDLDDEFELLSDSSVYTGFVLDEGVINSIIIAFRMESWFAFNDSETNSSLTVDFSDIVTVDTGGGVFKIILDKDQTGNNAVIRTVVKENIKLSADYGEDEDDDGILESDEDED